MSYRKQNFLVFDANAKLLNFTEKLKTASGNYMVNNIGQIVISAVCHRCNS